MSALVTFPTPAPAQLFLDIGTEASPLCSYERCTRHGRVILGPAQPLDGCINRDMNCLRCGATGIRSTNTEQRQTKRRNDASIQ